MVSILGLHGCLGLHGMGSAGAQKYPPNVITAHQAMARIALLAWIGNGSPAAGLCPAGQRSVGRRVGRRRLVNVRPVTAGPLRRARRGGDRAGPVSLCLGPGRLGLPVAHLPFHPFLGERDRGRDDDHRQPPAPQVPDRKETTAITTAGMTARLVGARATPATVAPYRLDSQYGWLDTLGCMVEGNHYQTPVLRLRNGVGWFSLGRRGRRVGPVSYQALAGTTGFAGIKRTPLARRTAGRMDVSPVSRPRARPRGPERGGARKGRPVAPAVRHVAVPSLPHPGEVYYRCFHCQSRCKFHQDLHQHNPWACHSI